jgi:hypothetical protein
MKRFFGTLVALAFFAAVAACGTLTSTSPAQQALDATVVSCKNIDAAIVAADQAVKSGVLKGQDARNAVKGLATAQAGCNTALAAYQSAASGVSK